MTIRVLLVVACFLCSHLAAFAGQNVKSSSGRVGVALLIANSAYKDAELPSVREDQRRMGLALKSLGFDVAQVHDLTHPQDFEEEIRAFLKEKNAAAEDLLLIYYSGHGLQIDGEPQLLGTGITPSQEGSLRAYSKSVNEIIRLMEGAAPSSWVLIVDACRNNPFSGSTHKAGVSLNQNDEDAYVLFADEPGKKVPARLENGLESPFTAALLYAFETSSESLENRFEIAAEKTRQLNPNQNPVMYRSQKSANRNKPFLDYDGHSAPSDSAGRLLAEARGLYEARSWKLYYDRVATARILSTDSGLSARLDKEIRFARLVLDAEEAQNDQDDPKWKDAALDWQNAGDIFPARFWVKERAALCWLLGDRLAEAAAVLSQLRAYSNNPASIRAGKMLDQLIQTDHSLESVARSIPEKDTAPTGPEFEEYTAVTP